MQYHKLWQVMDPDVGPIILRHVESARSITQLLMSHRSSLSTWPTMKADCNTHATAVLRRSVLQSADKNDVLWHWASSTSCSRRADGETVGRLYHKYFTAATLAFNVSCMVITEELRTADLLTLAVMRDPHAICDIRGVGHALHHEAVRACGMSLRHIPLSDRTPALCMRAVRSNAMALMYVPCKLRTHDICNAAVNQNGLSIQHVPKLVATPAMCQTAVQNTALAIRDIPVELLTEDMCYCAVKSDRPEILRMVPVDFRTEYVCMAAVSMHGMALRHVPGVHSCKENIVVCAIQQDRDAACIVSKACLVISAVQMALARVGQLQVIPVLHRTPMLCRVHCEASGSLRHVPMHLRTAELCSLAVTIHSAELHNVPASHLTRELCMLAVRGSGLQLARVPLSMQDAKMCLLAVSSHGRALCNVRNDLRTSAVIQVALRTDGTLISLLPHRVQTTQFCCIAVEQTACALAYVQWNLIPTPEERDRVCITAVRYHGTSGMRSVLNAQRGNELSSWYPLLSAAVQHSALCHHGHVLSLLEVEHIATASLQAAVASYPAALVHIPEAMQTADMYLRAVSSCGRMLHLVPSMHRSEPLCMAAIKEDPHALQYAPSEIRKRLAVAAVSLCGQALHHVPHAWRTRALCVTAMCNPFGRPQGNHGTTKPLQHSRCRSSYSPLHSVPHDFIDHDMCVAALNADPLAIAYVPMHMRRECASRCAWFCTVTPVSWQWQCQVPLDAAHVESWSPDETSQQPRAACAAPPLAHSRCHTAWQQRRETRTDADHAPCESSMRGMSLA